MFRQNWVNIYLQKIASCINLQLPVVYFEKKKLFQTCIILKHTCISIFSKNRLSRSIEICPAAITIRHINDKCAYNL